MDEGSIENQERGSLASFGSGNTTDSEKASRNFFICYFKFGEDLEQYNFHQV